MTKQEILNGHFYFNSQHLGCFYQTSLGIKDVFLPIILNNDTVNWLIKFTVQTSAYIW